MQDLTRALVALLPCLFALACNPSPDTPADAGASLCPTPTSGPTQHPAGTLTADEVWTADGSPHIVTGTIGVRAHLTIEACAVVRLEPNAGFYVDQNGVLDAQGQQQKLVVFQQNQTGSRWSSLDVRPPGLVKLTWSVVSGGGANNGSGAQITLVGNGVTPYPQMLLVDHTMVTDSAGYGVAFTQGAGFADGSNTFTVTKSGQDTPAIGMPILVPSTTMDTVPVGDYTGNAVDAIDVVPEGPIVRDMTLAAQTVPYVVGGNGASSDLRVGNGSSGMATLTLLPGVTMQFFQDARFDVSPGVGAQVPTTGALVAVGNASNPIVFEPAAQGQRWAGIRFGATPASTNQLAYVHVVGAGGSSGSVGSTCPQINGHDDGAVVFFGQPSGVVVTNSLVQDSAGHGISMAFSGVQVDMRASNTFDTIAGCTQSTPKDTSNSCPTNACPP